MNPSAYGRRVRALVAAATSLGITACAAASRGGGPAADPEARFAPDSIPGICPGATITLAAARDTQPRPEALIPLPTGVVPRMPRSYLRARPPEDRVVASFVVDTAGQVVPGSVALLAGNDRRYASTVCEWLPRMSFTRWRADTASTVRIAMPFQFGVPLFGPRGG